MFKIPEIIFTGGEPFERLDVLVAGVLTAASHGVDVAVYTSSFWASTYDKACEILGKLPGLMHLYSIDRGPWPR